MDRSDEKQAEHDDSVVRENDAPETHVLETPVREAGVPETPVRETDVRETGVAETGVAEADAPEAGAAGSGPRHRAPRARAAWRPEPLSPRAKLIFLGLLLGLLLAVLDQTVTGTAAWTIVRDIGKGNVLDQIPWLATAYMMSATVATPLFGRMADMYGSRAVYGMALVLFLAGSLIAGPAGNLTEVIGGRAVQGLGAGGLIAVTFAVVGHIVPPRDRGRYTGMAMGVVGIASVCGPLLGGYLAERSHILGLVTSWRWVFYINVPFGLLVLAMVPLLPPLRERPEGRRHIDYLGSALMVAGIWAWLLAVQWGGEKYPWRSRIIIGLAVAGLILLVLFAVRERMAKAPLIPPSLFANSIFLRANTISFVMGAALLGSVFYVTLYLQVVYGMTPVSAGLHLIPLMLGLMVTSMIAGQLMAHWGRYKLFPIIGSVLAAAGLGSLVTLQADTPGWMISLLLVVTGAGIGFATAVLSVVVLNAVPVGEYGVASSSINFTQTLGGVLGAAVFGAMIDNTVTRDLPSGGSSGPGVTNLSALPRAARGHIIDTLVHSIHPVFLVAACLAVVALIAGVLLREIPLRKGLDTTGI